MLFLRSYLSQCRIHVSACAFSKRRPAIQFRHKNCPVPSQIVPSRAESLAIMSCDQRITCSVPFRPVPFRSAPVRCRPTMQEAGHLNDRFSIRFPIACLALTQFSPDSRLDRPARPGEGTFYEICSVFLASFVPSRPVPLMPVRAACPCRHHYRFASQRLSVQLRLRLS